MKIGILTFHRTTNFGAQLHTIALYKKIKELGGDPEVIDYKCKFIEDKELPSRKKIWWTLKGVAYWMIYMPRQIAKERAMEADLRRHTRLSEKSYQADDIHLSNDIYDRFIVGSDVVWGLDFSNGDYTYFLDFVNDNSKKFSFSTSVGNTDKFLDDKRAASLLSQFDTIYVRETHAAEWVKSLAQRDCEVVCDPTLLLTSQEWSQLVKPRDYTGDYLLIYFPIGDKIIPEAKLYAKQHNLKIKIINYDRGIAGMDNERPINISQFIGLIKNAKMVFTASYHGLLFAINYNIQVRFYNRGGTSRMSSVARILNMEKSDSSLCQLSNIYHIDYDKVNIKLKEFRDMSLAKLKDIITAK